MDDQQIVQSISTLFPARSWARWYAARRTQYFLPRFKMLVKHIPKGARIVDVGCGYGLTAHLFALLRDDISVVGIDTNDYRIKHARETAKGNSRVSFALADARTFSFAKEDAIVFVDVLHHIPYNDHEALLRRLSEETREGGQLILADVEKEPLWKYVLSYVIDTVLYPRSMRCQFYKREDMHALLAKTGWRLQETQSTASGTPFSSVLYIARS